MTLRGSGSGHASSATRIASTWLRSGLAAGDDLIVQLSVDDNRTPAPQNARSASLILRWPSDLGTETTGLEGMVKKVLPAYFRSQRQIIIDAEALLKEKAQARRRALSSSAATRSASTSASCACATASSSARKPRANRSRRRPTMRRTRQRRRRQAPKPLRRRTSTTTRQRTRRTAFGQDGDVLEEYGHTHDHAEAATLLDPETRTTLKAALDQMWQSEAAPAPGPSRTRAAVRVPRAEVHQAGAAGHAHLPGARRPGTAADRREPAPERRPRRPGASRRCAGGGRPPPIPTLAGLWRRWTSRRIARAAPASTSPRWSAGCAQHETRLADPLAFVAAIDALRADPECATCRATCARCCGRCCRDRRRPCRVATTATPPAAAISMPCARRSAM